MIVFNPENKKTLTYGEALRPAMGITDKKEAEKYLRDYIKWLAENHVNGNLEEAERIAKANIGYYSGYCDQETMTRVQELFEACHPVFGDRILSYAQAIEEGRKRSTP